MLPPIISRSIDSVGDSILSTIAYIISMPLEVSQRAIGKSCLNVLALYILHILVLHSQHIFHLGEISPVMPLHTLTNVRASSRRKASPARAEVGSLFGAPGRGEAVPDTKSTLPRVHLAHHIE